MNLRGLAERAKSQMAEVTGLKAVGVTETFKDEHGWHIAVDMLEMSRVPDTTDVLGDYDVLLDDNGDLLRFVRTRTHLRGESAERNGNGK